MKYGKHIVLFETIINFGYYFCENISNNFLDIQISKKHAFFG